MCIYIRNKRVYICSRRKLTLKKMTKKKIKDIYLKKKKKESCKVHVNSIVLLFVLRMCNAIILFSYMYNESLSANYHSVSGRHT